MLQFACLLWAWPRSVALGSSAPTFMRFQGLNRHTPHLICTVWGVEGWGWWVCTQCACVISPPPFDPFEPLEWAHAQTHTHAHALPYFQWKVEPQPRLLKVHLASASPLQLHLPQLEAMNQLVTLSFYSCRITLTAAPRKFRGICPLRWAEGHTQARIGQRRDCFLEGRIWCWCWCWWRRWWSARLRRLWRTALVFIFG